MFVCLHPLYHLVSLWFSCFNIELSERLGTHSVGCFLIVACSRTEIFPIERTRVNDVSSLEYIALEMNSFNSFVIENS